MPTIPDFQFYVEVQPYVEELISLPGCYRVCPGCQGRGQITNPSIGAITAEEWLTDWDEEEREGYLTGRYDITCPTCQGQRVTLAVDREKADAAELALYDRWVEDQEALEAERRAEIQWGF